MFTVALFSIVRSWKQLNVHQWRMDEDNMVHAYNGILLSRKKEEIMPYAATWMELEGVTLSEVGQTEKDKYHMISNM